MKKLILLILFSSCLAALGQEDWRFPDYRLKCHEADAVEKLLAEWPKKPYQKLEIQLSENCGIPKLPAELNIKSVTLYLYGGENEWIDVFPLNNLELEELSIHSRGYFRNFYAINSAGLKSLSGEFKEKFPDQDWPSLEELSIRCSSKVLDLRHAPKLRKLSIYHSFELEEILFSPEIKLKELVLMTPKLKKIPEFDKSEITRMHLYFSPQSSDLKPNWSLASIAAFHMPELVDLSLTGFSGRALVLPVAPKLKTLALERLEITGLNGLEKYSLDSLNLYRIPELWDLSPLQKMNLEELHLHDIPACTKVLPKLNPGCKVSSNPRPPSDWKTVWSIYAICIAIVFAWTGLYQRLKKQTGKKEGNP